MAKRTFRRLQRKPRSRKLKGYELQNIILKIGMPLALMFAVIACVFFTLALAAGAGPLRAVCLAVALLFLATAFMLYIKAWLAQRFLQAYHSILELRQMNPIEFEHYIANLFRKLGYRAKVTGGAGDNGVDVILSKDGHKAVVQCKRYAPHWSVDSPAIQQFIGSMRIYGVEKGFFVATSRFTPPAQKLAAAHNIETVDDVRLVELIRKTFT